MNTARSTPTCGAASPAPLAAVLVANMSHNKFHSSGPNSVTGWEGRCRTGCPQRVIGRAVPEDNRSSSGIGGLLVGLIVVAGAPGLEILFWWRPFWGVPPRGGG